MPKPNASAFLVLFLLLESGLLVAVAQASETVPESLVSPSCGSGIIAGTRGDIEVKINCSGIAVRIEIPREFLKGRSENDTSFLSSDIASDYFYYSLVDESLHYSYSRNAPGRKSDFPPYDPNAPFMAEIWSHDGSGFIEFTPPKHVCMRSVTAPTVAGKYEFLVYVANEICDETGKPLFPVNATQRLSILVSQAPFPASVSGFIVDPMTRHMLPIKAKGVVYALDRSGKLVARSLVDSDTGFFNMTGLSVGEYVLEASAGYWKETGCAYVLTRYAETIRVFRNSKLALNITLNRGCVISGEIKYTKPDGTLIPSLSHPGFLGLCHPWRNSIDRVASLDYTVEAFTDAGEVAASFRAKSGGVDRDHFILVDRAEMRHVGYPPIGTAYSGLPPGRYTLKAWVFGYVQKTPRVLTVTSSSTEYVEIRLVTGSLVVGTMSFHDPRTLRPETPRTAERTNFGTSTGTLYGGNVLVSAYDSTRQLAAVTLIEGVTSNGTIPYADLSSIRFYLLGFSESLNRTFSGVWKRRDCGIPSGTYSIKVHVRGYRQQDVSAVTVSEGLNSTAYVRLVRQGAIRAVVASSAIVSGISVEVPWAFADLTQRPYLRVYEYREGGSEVGYVETRIGLGTLATRTLPLNFTGRNCAMPDIVFQGYLPNSVIDGTYVLRAFTFGYVQRSDVKVKISDGIAIQTGIQLYSGLNATGTISIVAGGLLASVTENAEVKIEAYNSLGELSAVTLARPKSGVSSFDFALMGLRGEGHFFYVTSNGHRVKDYGIPAGAYTLKVCDFGEEWRYRVGHQPTLKLESSGSAVHLVANRMGKVFGKVWGITPDNTLIALSWVAVTAGSEMSFSSDGKYTLHLGDGTYQLIFSLPGYSERIVNCTVAGSDKIERDITLNPF